MRKGLGQHFLNDRRILARIVDAVAPTAGETVIEIGPGRGSLTDMLVNHPGVGRLVAVEYDRALAAGLAERYEGDDRVSIVQADVLDVNLAQLAGGPYALVGNVPYYITTPILFHSLRRPRATRAVFLVQREVAERMAAAPGSKTYGALSVNLQAVADAEVQFRVPAGAFSPPPKVESAVVRVVPRETPLVTPEEEEPFRAFVQNIFGMRRKQMKRVLRGLAGFSVEEAETVLRANGVEPEARPEVLSPERLAVLFRAIRR